MSSDEIVIREGKTITTAPYDVRASRDLKNIIEDQWIKELHQLHDDDNNTEKGKYFVCPKF